MNLLWFEKHRPKKLKELLIQKKDLQVVQKWINNFTQKVKGTPNCLFLHGPPGIGKTSLANIILSENGFDVCEFNASEVRNQKQIKEQINEINGKWERSRKIPRKDQDLFVADKKFYPSHIEDKKCKTEIILNNYEHLDNLRSFDINGKEIVISNI